MADEYRFADMPSLTWTDIRRSTEPMWRSVPPGPLTPASTHMYWTSGVASGNGVAYYTVPYDAFAPKEPVDPNMQLPEGF